MDPAVELQFNLAIVSDFSRWVTFLMTYSFRSDGNRILSFDNTIQICQLPDGFGHKSEIMKYGENAVVEFTVQSKWVISNRIHNCGT